MISVPKTILAVAFAATTFWGCNNVEKTTEEPAAPTTTESTEFSNIEGVLQLNGTEKWVANKETNEGIANMQAAVSDFKSSSPAEDLARYNQFAAALKNNMGQIFEQCTMTGDAHEELHDFLMPILDYINALRGPDINAAKLALTDLEVYLKKYDTYFK